jgi:formylglycine-generating enzyme required for sulfatase activity
MKIKNSFFLKVNLAILCAIFLVSCQPERSMKTGWHFNSPENFGSGYEKFPAMDQETGPGLTLIEGGTFTMGRSERLDFMPSNDDNPRKVTVPSFYMDQTEVSNFDYLEYLFWLGRVYGSVDPENPLAYNADGTAEGTPEPADPPEFLDSILGIDGDTSAFKKFAVNYTESFTSNYREVFRKALPDTLCWRSPLASMEHFVNYYLRHPAYRDYPVVGVSWIQANDYCKWRTDRVNEYILAREGILDWEMGNKELNPFQMFSTEAYLGGQYFGLEPQPREKNRSYGEEEEEEEEEIDDVIDDKQFTVKSEPDNGRRLRNYNPSARSVNKGGKGNYGARIVRMEDGILLPNYRLPTEAEWEYAATGLIGNLQDNSENITDRRTYPWNGHWVRREEEQFQGSIQVNFMRTSGDYMGIAGNLNDGAAPTAPVESYWPNDFGLFHMAGNVSEWVQDVYRPNSLDDVDGFSPFRGNVYTTKLTTTLGLNDAMKNDRIRYDVHGMKEYVLDFERVRYQRIAATDGSGTKPEWDPTQQRGTGKNPEDYEVYFPNDVYVFSKFGDEDSKYKERTVPTDTFKTLPALGALVAASSAASASAAGGGATGTTGTGATGTGTTGAGAGAVSSTPSVDLVFSIKGSQAEFEIDKKTGVLIAKKGILTKPGIYNIDIEAKESKSGFSKTFTIKIEVTDKKLQSPLGQNMQSRSSNPAEAKNGAAPDPLFVSSGNTMDVLNIKGSQYKKETEFLDSVNYWIDSAIFYSNNLKTTQATRLINNRLWGRIFSDAYIAKMFPNYLDDPALTTMISVLRNGLTEYVIETEGQMRYRRVTEEENLGRLNYRKDDYIDYLDGDIESSIFFQNKERKDAINLGKRDPKLVMYQSNHERYNLDGSAIGNGEKDFRSGEPTTLVSDRSRVYKGGSWEDNAYWIGCGRRRFLDETQSTRNIGFRCAMDRVGSPTGKNYGKKKKRKS